LTKQEILDAAYEIALKRGVHNVMKKHIAAHLKCGMGTVNYHCKTMAAIRRTVIARARGAGTLLDIYAGK